MTKSISGKIFYLLEKIWQNFRIFFHNNDSLFELIFLLIYFLEQLGLVYFIMLFKEDMVKLPYIVTFFALILLTTVGVHRLIMESKNRFIKEKYDTFKLRYHKLGSDYKSLEGMYKQQKVLLENTLKRNQK